jgi:hypothetical protein
LVLIGLPAAALFYDFRKGGDNTMLASAPHKAASDASE